MVKLLVLLGLGGVVAALALKSKTSSCATPTNTVGPLPPGCANRVPITPNYNPVAAIFAPDQANSGNQNPITAGRTVTNVVGPLPVPSGDTLPSGANGSWISNPLGKVLAKPNPCNAGGSGCLPDAPASGLSPSFWSADNVPTNPALEVDYNSLSADPTLTGGSQTNPGATNADTPSYPDTTPSVGILA